MADCIDRQAAIDAVSGCGICIQRIVDIPTVDAVEVRHGRWGKVNECSECGCQPWYERDIHFLHYCPNCGARMDGEA